MTEPTDRAGCPVADLPGSPGLREFPFERADPLQPPPLFDRFRQTAPVARVRLWNGDEPWLVTGHAQARTLLADPRVSVSRHDGQFPFTSPTRQAVEQMETSFIVLDPPDHGPLRKLFTRFFTVRRVAGLRPVVAAIVDDLISDMVAAGPPADLVTALAAEVPARTMCHLLGLPLQDRHFFRTMDTARNTLTSSPMEARSATREVLSYIDGIIGDRIDHPADDLVSQLVTDHLNSGAVSRDMLRAMLRHLLAAGHDTTTQMIALGTLTLLRHPDQLSLLRADPSRIPGAVEELLRYIPLFQISPNRVAADDIDVDGVQIRRGDGIIIPPAAANRDPAAFPHPDVLDVERDATGHIAFAYGIHQCLGQNLARMELQVVFESLLRRLPSLAPADPTADPAVSDYLLLRLTELPVVWDTSHDSSDDCPDDNTDDSPDDSPDDSDGGRR